MPKEANVAEAADLMADMGLDAVVPPAAAAAAAPAVAVPAAAGAAAAGAFTLILTTMGVENDIAVHLNDHPEIQVYVYWDPERRQFVVIHRVKPGRPILALQVQEGDVTGDGVNVLYRSPETLGSAEAYVLLFQGDMCPEFHVSVAHFHQVTAGGRIVAYVMAPSL